MRISTTEATENTEIQDQVGIDLCVLCVLCGEELERSDLAGDDVFGTQPVSDSRIERTKQRFQQSLHMPAGPLFGSRPTGRLHQPASAVVIASTTTRRAAADETLLLGVRVRDRF